MAHRLSQHVDLYVDFKRRLLRGCAKLYISISKPAPNILIHCAQLNIKSVRLGDVAVTTQLSNLCQSLVQSPQSEVCDGNTYRVFWKAAQEASEEYDLMVHLPAAAPDASWPQQYELNIEYELSNPQGGLYFVMPQETTHPNRREHCYTVSELGCARMWMPCVDFPVARCTWKIDINVPDTMHAVCVGELKERSPSDQQNRVKYSYALDTPTAAHQILWAVGPFESIHDSPPVQLLLPQQQQKQQGADQSAAGSNGENANPEAPNGVEGTAQSQQASAASSASSQSNPNSGPQQGVITPPWRSGVLATSHCLPGRLPLLTHTCKDTVSRAIEHLEQHLKLRFPYQSMKCVFVEAPFDKMIVGAGMLILSTHLLHSSRILDQHVKTKRTLWLGMSKCWVSSQVVLRSWHDTWIETGLASYLCSTVYRHVYGLNMH
jgi:aminopeptidase N